MKECEMRDNKGKFIKGHISYLKGKNHSPKSIKKIKQTNYLRPQLFKKGNITWNTGKGKVAHCLICGKKIKRYYPNIKYCSRGCFAKARKGYILSEEVKKKISKKHKGKFVEGTGFKKGEKNPAWKGGSPRRERDKLANEIKKWRKDVFKKDNYKCQICGTIDDLQAHHIHGWATYPNYRFNINNGQTLCKKCHRKTKNYAGKKITEHTLKIMETKKISDDEVRIEMKCDICNTKFSGVVKKVLW